LGFVINFSKSKTGGTKWFLRKFICSFLAFLF
jgi:hypothetical protein